MSCENRVSNAGESLPIQQLQEMLGGYRKTQLIYVAAQLGIADKLKDGPKTTEELAQATGAHPRNLYRVLRTLAGLGVFAEDSDGRFQLTALSAHLTSDVPNPLYYGALWEGSETVWQPWGNLYQSVMTGEDAFLLTHGARQYEYLQQHPEVYERVNTMMATRDAAVREGVIDAYDFSGIVRLVDVGGGYGQNLVAILKKYPQMHGVLFDLPSVIEAAKDRIQNENIAHRCTLVGGSHFESVPSGDACLVKSVLMGYSETDVTRILTHCRHAVGAEGRVLVIERLLRGTPDMFMDLTMMVIADGYVRTEAEYRNLLDSAGLKLTRVIPTPSQYSILEAVPA
jgi:hypothetical protein